MLGHLARVLLLVLRTKAEWPEYGFDKIIPVVGCAIAEEDRDTEQHCAPSAELLIAIAQHESDFEPRAISWLDDKHFRHDHVLRDGEHLDHDRRFVYGYLQAMCSDAARCEREMTIDGGMRAGAAELVEWAGNCARWGMRGSMTCVLRGHAGGTACALDVSACSPAQRAFVQIFETRAWDLAHWRLDLHRRAG